MSELKETRSLEWPLGGNQRLAWYSPTRRTFVIGNHADKSVVPIDGGPIMPLVTRADAYAVKTYVYDDQLPTADYEELRAQGLDGFTFLTASQYDDAFTDEKWGSTCPVDQALTSGLACRVPVMHPGSGAIVSVADRKIVLRGKDDPHLAPLGEAKLKGPLTAIAAVADRIVYGTNAGDLIALPLTADKLGTQKKLAAFGRVVNSIRPAADGKLLFAGGMGFVAAIDITGKSAEIVAKLEISCRSISVLSDRWLLLNQGMHGLSLCEFTGNSLKLGLSLKLSAAVDRVFCSADGATALALLQPPAGIVLVDCRAIA